MAPPRRQETELNAPDKKAGAMAGGGPREAGDEAATTPSVPRWNVEQIVAQLRALRGRWRDAHQRPREGAGRELGIEGDFCEVGCGVCQFVGGFDQRVSFLAASYVRMPSILPGLCELPSPKGDTTVAQHVSAGTIAFLTT